MQNIFDHYIQSISSKFSHLETSEMGYRADFEILLKGIFESIKVRRVDHDARARQGNRPDFIVLNKDVPLLYIEAKDIGVSLDKVEKSEQMKRYFGYTNLVLTDYLEFRFYRNGLPYEQPIKIASYDLKNRLITPLSQNYDHLVKTLLDFTQSQKEPIKSGKHLARIMGGKAQRIRDNLRHFMSFDHPAQNIELFRIYEAIKKMLVHDLTIDTFSDMYAQTLVYGLFVARYYDDSPDTFSRQESRDLVPASNPFLQHFFDHIAGPNFDKRLSYIVDELCVVFLHADTKKLIEEYMGDADPVIHFYEDFLKEYDPALRKKMGAYYTPLPVVKFIIRSVDYILQKEFNLPNGLADTSKLPNNKHRVQILDPAVGTGTFISTTITTIHERLKEQGQPGRWLSYVHNDLLPRLYGFELMMTPYIIAHLKVSIALRETGFKYFNETKTGKTRLRVYLTNSLEQSEPQQDLLSFGFAESIAGEAKEAEIIKNSTPIMVIVGNPPYSGISSNETEFANNLVKKYKVEPGGNQKLQERKHWLNDDYVKFIALAESMIEKNGEGILGFITNHGYLDNPTFRGMRWHLINTFDSIYIIDLHGNAKKKEVSPNGSKDENIFDIQQGVAIIIAIKNEKKKGDFAKVYRLDLWGKREDKFSQLNTLLVENAKWKVIEAYLPSLLFVQDDSIKIKKEYENGFSIVKLFTNNSLGLMTARDNLFIDTDSEKLKMKMMKAFGKERDSDFDIKFEIKNTKSYKLLDKLELGLFSEEKIKQINYRPFDEQYCYYCKDIISRALFKIQKHMLNKNIGIIIGRQGQAVGKMQWNLSFITKSISDLNMFYRGGGMLFPLYLYTNDGSQIPNLKKEIVGEIEKIVGKVSPEDIFDYIYAVLHSPNYREKYKEFLKIDFPRVPYPKDTKTFQNLVAFGAELRSLHLLESPKVNQFITTYPITGFDTVEKLVYKDGKVFINSEQYFGNVPEVAWNFYIGGYQPAQKWLKDRKRRALTNTDIEHYQKIIVALAETNRIMKEIASFTHFSHV